MSTTRHLINRQRRTAAVAARGRLGADTRADAAEPLAEPLAEQAAERAAASTAGQATETATETAAEPAAEPKIRLLKKPAPKATSRLRAPLALALATVLLGGFAAFAQIRADEARDDSGGNSALVDAALTSEVKGGVSDAVNAVFSVDYNDLGRNEAAAEKYLTGAAVGQHRAMLAEIRAQAPQQKLVLTTTVTDAGVELAGGDRARVLVFADQRNTRTDKDQTSFGAAMLAVEAQRVDGIWKINDIETFG
ncbi:hypothetical protein ACFQLX_05945 [Streptomyces polyrhachis]|uniref:Mce-associated membrane protein n=1 Tax=Streptomyces polyrhachis TaxID=1282885 RepID=A0ABW2GEA5_9ACTN